MSRLALINMIIGFTVLFLAAAGGAFVATDLVDGYLRDPEILGSWQTTLLAHSHGHTNLFAMIHILLGLTLPYSALSLRVKTWQTWGLLAGTLAMGPGMVVRAYQGPRDNLEPLGILLGLALSMALLSLISHSAGLYMKLVRRGN